MRIGRSKVLRQQALALPSLRSHRSLTKAAADALNAAFGVTAFKKGLVLGVATVNAKVK
ncbi:MAG: hypothetical protein HYX29_09140 [Solirubrobacterales bacterium]|nr:hypothetical protein [Solirubrobacterales bacterium]